MTEAATCKIAITDNGIGIDPHDFDRIFDIFTKLNPPSKYQGSGIGLTTCQKIVQQLGGYITVTSEIGTGTTFTVHLLISESALS